MWPILETNVMTKNGNPNIKNSFTRVRSEEDDGARILSRCDIINFSSGCLQHSSKMSWEEGEDWLNLQDVYKLGP